MRSGRTRLSLVTPWPASMTTGGRKSVHRFKLTAECAKIKFPHGFGAIWTVIQFRFAGCPAGTRPGDQEGPFYLRSDRFVHAG